MLHKRLVNLTRRNTRLRSYTDERLAKWIWSIESSSYNVCITGTMFACNGSSDMNCMECLLMKLSAGPHLRILLLLLYWYKVRIGLVLMLVRPI